MKPPSPILIACCLFLSTLAQTAYAESQLRMQPTELVANIDKVTILDARSPSLYAQGHIKNALNFPVSWTFETQGSGKITKPGRIQVILRDLGIDINTPVVIYDDGTLVDSARLFWTLEVYGLKQVKVLNSGFDSWIQNNRPLGLDSPKVNSSQYVPVINHKRIATKFSTQIATQNPNSVVIDARPVPAYEGKLSSAKRFGHIPSAISIPASHNINSEHDTASLQPLNELKEIYKDIPKDKNVVLYCAVGKISSTNYFALRELGYNVSNYDSSWKEWGNDFTLPIVQPKKNSILLKMIR